MPLKNKSKGVVPWDYQIDDENYQKEPWILKKGKEYVTIEKDKDNKGFFLLQKDEEKRLSINAMQIKLTYELMKDFNKKIEVIENNDTQSSLYSSRHLSTQNEEKGAEAIVIRNEEKLREEMKKEKS